MKANSRMFVTVLGLALLFAPGRLTAQNIEDHTQHHHYKLIDAGTFGGPESYFPETTQFISAKGDLGNAGLAVGGSATSTPTTATSNSFMPNSCGGISGSVPFVFHAIEWRDGVVTDLGTLGGPESCSGASGINASGEIVGGSENGEIDPLTGINQFRPVRWKDDHIYDLGSFGGNQGAAISINNHGLIVGGSNNTTPDSFSIFDLLLGSSNGTQTRAFLWKDGAMQDLGTLGGPDAVAILVNEHGQIAGISYTNTTPTNWPGKGGKMQDLGTFGGTYGWAIAINDSGDIVGYASITGDVQEFALLRPSLE